MQTHRLGHDLSLTPVCAPSKRMTVLHIFCAAPETAPLAEDDLFGGFPFPYTAIAKTDSY